MGARVERSALDERSPPIERSAPPVTVAQTTVMHMDALMRKEFDSLVERADSARSRYMSAEERVLRLEDERALAAAQLQVLDFCHMTCIRKSYGQYSRFGEVSMLLVVICHIHHSWCLLPDVEMGRQSMRTAYTSLACDAVARFVVRVCLPVPDDRSYS